MRCRICGDERAEYRTRSRMVLCGSCHAGTPAKATFTEFVSAIVTGERDGQRVDVERTLSASELASYREFYSDYKTSTYGDVLAYWQSCSEYNAVEEMANRRGTDRFEIPHGDARFPG